ncbi:major facilitator superfamily domain-containing protein [Lipomyces tetrasporus]|uniref:Major facilitator superfamily domain-containing protein n=1 Tax=Lipomyces tetrasporus TaxID=54092 RepID=A0AAD7QTI9_9ASCO|nr:major facilitator superfamily domain-containing protein [Lipomyces tetrasporus]KAJ8101232.1 major facilitator superfamily domain-containing protein [Lipomyces tetrasporus]
MASQTRLKSFLSRDSVKKASAVGYDASLIPFSATNAVEPCPGGNMGELPQYKSYKRRWYGLLALMLLNLIASWGWLTFAPISDSVATFYHLSSESPVNWLATVILFGYGLASVPCAFVLKRRGVKSSMLIAAILLIVGNWIRVVGAKCNGGKGSFGVLMFGQIIIGFGQPFALNAPSYYSDMWYTSKSRISANALASLSNPLGGAIGQLVSPLLVTEPNELPDMILYVAIIATVACLPSLFVFARPPLPPCPSAATPKLPFRKSPKLLLYNRRFVIVFIVFSVLVGFFNAFSSLINQIMEPYGYSSDEAGIDGAVMIVAGLIFSAVISPILDRIHSFLLAIRIQVPIVSICYICLIFTQTKSGQLAGPFVISGVLGAASFSLLPVALEWVQEQVFPVSPELTSSILWVGGNFFGGVFIIIMDALKRPPNEGDPPGNMTRALIFQAVVAAAVIPLPFMLGSREQTRNRRVELDAEMQSSPPLPTVHQENLVEV